MFSNISSFDRSSSPPPCCFDSVFTLLVAVNPVRMATYSGENLYCSFPRTYVFGPCCLPWQRWSEKRNVQQFDAVDMA